MNHFAFIIEAYRMAGKTTNSDRFLEKGYIESDTGLLPLRNRFLYPTSKLDDQKFEFYFLIDVSWSMEGKPWDLASRALMLFRHSLPEDCYFNVISFASYYKCMYPASVKYSQKNLEDAKSKIPNLFIGGSTNIFEALEHIYTQEQIPGYLTQIFVLTDWDVECSADVVELVNSNAQHSRCFSLGIGPDVDVELVKDIARNAGGTSEFVNCNDFMESKILKQLKSALQSGQLKPIRDAAASRLVLLAN